MSGKKRKQGKNQHYKHTKWDQTNVSLNVEREGEQKKFNPAARRILFGDLVMLGVTQLLYTQKIIGDTVTNILTLVGLALLLLGLWYQFGPSKDKV